MKTPIKRIVGALALLLGFIALVTPLTPCSSLMFIGLELLGIGFLVPQSICRKLPKRFHTHKKEGSDLPSVANEA